MPGDVDIYARMIPQGSYESMRPEYPTATTRRSIRRVIEIKRTTPEMSKTGLDADIFAAAGQENVLFVQRCRTAAQRTEKYRTAERAQLFIQQADPPGADVPRYVELEFTSPRGTSRPASPPSCTSRGSCASRPRAGRMRTWPRSCSTTRLRPRT